MKFFQAVNVIFNFKNTYCELLSSNGDGLGAELVNSAIEEQGDGLIGVVLGTNNIEESFSTLKKIGGIKLNLRDLIAKSCADSGSKLKI